MDTTDLQVAAAALLVHDCDHAVTPSELVLRHGRGGRVLVRLVSDGKLWRIAWPDIGPSLPVNLTRAKEAARLWAKAQYLRENRRQRSLKSLDNFLWSSSPVRKSGAA